MCGEMKKGYWEHFPHQADIGIRGVGPDKQHAFEQAATALTAVITDPQKVEPKQEVKITCQHAEDEILFVDWINSLIYEMAVRRMLFSRFDVNIKQNHLKASVWGEKIDSEKHQPVVEIKGATYTALSVGQNEDGSWVVQCIVDV